MLRMRDVVGGYRGAVVVKGVSFEVPKGETRVILGPNGAGKTTILRIIMGILSPMAGTVELDGTPIQGWPSYKVAAAGMALVPEGRGTLSTMTTKENLEMGAFLVKSRHVVKERMEEVFNMFPWMRERQSQLAGTLSGGEQQALAIGRALMAAPNVLLLDEPSLGLSPLLCDHLFSMVERISSEGMTILMVEQNVERALEICNWAYVMEVGQIVDQGPPAAIRQSLKLRGAYLGQTTEAGGQE